MSNEQIGPSVWHGREILSCTRCKYLRCRLKKSGRHPDYDYFCMHPEMRDHSSHVEGHKAFMEKLAKKFPDKVAHFETAFQTRKLEVAQFGEFISNDEVTPETPLWCPVLKDNLPTPPAP